jgi:hypothetical protein
VDPLVTDVEEQQMDEEPIVVDAMHDPVDVAPPVTEQPTVVEVFVEHELEVPAELQEIVVKVAVELVHELDDDASVVFSDE